MKIKIKYHNKDLFRIKDIDIGDWHDLRIAEDVMMIKEEFALLSLGVSMELPEGYEAHVVPRSSLFKKHGIIQANHMGVIDNSYSGDEDIWMFPAIAMRTTSIPFNERICQFRIVEKQPVVIFEEVDRLENKNRGGIGEGTKHIQ